MIGARFLAHSPKLLRSVLIACLMAALSAPPSVLARADVGAQSAPAVSGIVTESGTANAVEGAYVWVSYEPSFGEPLVTVDAYTDATGYYELDLPAAGAYELNVTKEHFEPFRENVSYNGTSTTTRNVSLVKQKLWLYGTVRDASTNMPLENAYVQAVYDSTAQPYLAHTDAAGAYELWVAPEARSYQVSVGKTGFYEQFENLAFDGSSAVLKDVLLVEIDSGVRGRVTQQGTGAPIENAIVTVTFPGGAEQHSFTDSAGDYAAALVTAGSYSMRVTALGHKPQWSTFDFSGTGWVDRNFELLTNATPIAVADTYAILPNNQLNVSAPGVLANDSDADGDPLTASVESEPTNGILELNANGSLTYTPDPNFVGVDTFTYTASDGSATSAPAVVTIRVNTQPVAVNDSYSTAHNTKLAVTAANGVLKNDSDPDDAIIPEELPRETLTASRSGGSGPSHGTLSFSSNGGFTYTPSTGYVGTDSFTYRAYDGKQYSAFATVTITVGAAPTTATTTRLADRTRFSTAIAVARAGFPNWSGVKNVVIASGDDRAAADPLAASGLCWAYDAPMLLVSAARTPDEVKAALKQVTDANGTITLRIVGGTTSVPNTRIAELVAAGGGTGKVKVDRILASGGRYDLSAAIALRMRSVAAASPTKTMPSVALFANGADVTKFFDALALSPISAGTGAPILLVAADSIPPATLNAANTLKPSVRIVGGGPNTVSEKVRTQLSATRWSGQSRYDTAIAIANGAVSRGWLNRANVGIAAKLPDALTGGSFVGQKKGVLLLTDGANLTPATGSWLKTYKAQVKAVHVFGGALSVTETVMGQIRNALK